MHWAKRSACATSGVRRGPAALTGARLWQADDADWNAACVTPSCCRLGFGIAPLLSGSGNVGTPWVRMHALKATALGLLAGDGTAADADPVAEP
jgi:hypothetical protein